MVVLKEDFIASVKVNYPKTANKIIAAYEFAAAAHENIKRKSGEPYIIHPLSVAKILIDNDMDYATIMAGLLHDVVEDTEYTTEDIRKMFGSTVAKLVDGVTKINSIDYGSTENIEADSMKRLIIAMGNDIRVIFIKLADRLHNMRTIEFLSPEKQRKMALETKEIFIPIAEIIGIRKVRSELQNLVLKCLEPEKYAAIKTEFDAKYAKKEKKIKELQLNLIKTLKDVGIVSSISAWPEHYYSIYKKQNSQGIGKIYGLILFRIIVPNEMDCYKALGVIHKNFSPLPNQVQDFIASPKVNGYKSLQSTLVLPESNISFKVMIRTPEMDKVCEYGIASLWLDKDNDDKFDKSFESYNKLKEIVMSENTEFNNNSTSFINAIKNDLNVSSTWVFTPKFKPICLNISNPTVIDFAYALHTDIGHNALAATVNGKKVSLKTELVSGDVVNILVAEKDKAPSRTWLSIAKTSLAKKRIREYINKHTVSKYIKKGKDILSAELAKINHVLGDLVAKFDEIQTEYSFLSLEDMFASVGYDSITPEQLVMFVREEDESKVCAKTAAVLVEGSNKFSSILYPRCCSAIPGDNIVAVLTKNKVAVHTADCPNLKDIDESKKLKAEWKNNIKQKFIVSIKITAKDKVGFASELFGIVSNLKFNITRITASLPNEDECEIEISVSLKNREELNLLVKTIEKIRGVKSVCRSCGS